MNHLFRQVADRSYRVAGVYLIYDISPIIMNIVESRESLGHYITSIFAIIGGMVSIMGLVDTFLYNLIISLKGDTIL